MVAACAVGRHRDVTRLNYDYPDGEHEEWKVAATRKGQALKEWVRRSLNEVAERQQAERAEKERKQR